MKYVWAFLVTFVVAIALVQVWIHVSWIQAVCDQGAQVNFCNFVAAAIGVVFTPLIAVAAGYLTFCILQFREMKT